MDDMIRRQHGHHSRRRASSNHRRPQSDRCASIPAYRFADHIFLGQLRQLPTHFGRLDGVGDDENIGRRHQRPHPIHGLLQEGSISQKTNELLGRFLAAYGPKPLAASASHDDDKAVRRSTAGLGSRCGNLPGSRRRGSDWHGLDRFGWRLGSLGLSARSRLGLNGLLLGGQTLHELKVSSSNTRCAGDFNGFQPRRGLTDPCPIHSSQSGRMGTCHSNSKPSSRSRFWNSAVRSDLA